MRTKLIAAILASGCLLGFQGTTLAQDLNEHPSVANPSDAKKDPNAAAQYRDQGTSGTTEPGQPAPGPHEKR